MLYNALIYNDYLSKTTFLQLVLPRAFPRSRFPACGFMPPETNFSLRRQTSVHF